ncbi:hypothetical protein PHMEG_00031852 [Phytophthora megakarya]|uniref:Uncharacterized protein n=1 Tax=Phytophthora megakarya TaxID=4795 RepID=A0A225UX69_9STRA|nr:hypothetical protein PHMEG_00031852 [Phytophthora megakarya]
MTLSGSDDHNHTLNKHSFESYAENRTVNTVKDVELTRAVATLHRAGANAQCILRYLRERTGKKPFLEMFIIWCNGTKLLRKLD